jgi:hypothetical protein
MIKKNEKAYTFVGQCGNIIIQLGREIQVKHIQIESFGKVHSEESKLTSPKIIDFFVSLDGVNYKKLTSFRYDISNESLQTIKVDRSNGSKSKYIKVQIRSNYGSNETNIHSIKVFGVE